MGNSVVLPDAMKQAPGGRQPLLNRTTYPCFFSNSFKYSTSACTPSIGMAL
jgi:hypothetical protein